MEMYFFRSLAKLCKRILKWTFLFLCIVVFALIIRVFFVEFFKIPSSSMEPTLIPGDFILVSKMTYGPRILKVRKFFNKGKIEYTRSWGWSSIKKGDIFVFNWPNYGEALKSQDNIYGAFVVKRCYGQPGDTIKIQKSNHAFSSFQDIENAGSQLFPKDSSFSWTLENFGPLYVPKRGQKIGINPITIKLYKDIIGFENRDFTIIDNVLFIDSRPLKEYRFKNNYYFMLGDNFYGSIDSRYWGFVPEGNIIGKVKLILFSNGDEFHWSRIFKFIN